MKKYLKKYLKTYLIINMENKKLRVYFAHGMLHYNSKDIKLLESLGFEVINPNHEDNEKAYMKSKDFKVFLDIVKSCDILAFRSILGKITSGVGREIEFARRRDMPIIELPTFTSDRFLSLEETVEYCRPKEQIF